MSNNMFLFPFKNARKATIEFPILASHVQIKANKL